MTHGLNYTDTLTRTIQATVLDEDAMTQLVVNSTMFNFSRTSAQDSLPVMSKVVIGPVNGSLNGTVMNCVDLDTLSSSSTTIIIVEREPLPGMHNKNYNGLVTITVISYKINTYVYICMYSELE